MEAMDEVLNIDNIIDLKEVKTFSAYTRRNKHMAERSGIPNYNICLRSLPLDYFESWSDLNSQSSSIKRISPHLQTEDFKVYHDSGAAQDQIVEDLLTFERYSKFDVTSLQAVQIREAIIDDVNRATPAAMFEGSLEEWTAQLKDGTQQEIEEF
mmetsp:Transcript_44092/g.58520  ORF Transcript_44092/g.58520 Transcript_44092/m.58520 type:complete len:154 (-) Transcript_44092:798-1259(-)